MLKAAINQGKSPLALMIDPEIKLGKIRRKQLNRKLRLAWEILDSETCSRCGTVAWFGQSTNNMIQFDIKEHVCFGCVAVHDEEEARRKKGGKDYKPDPGMTLYPKAISAMEDDGIPLPGRDDWIKRALAEAKAEAEAKLLEKEKHR